MNELEDPEEMGPEVHEYDPSRPGPGWQFLHYLRLNEYWDYIRLDEPERRNQFITLDRAYRDFPRFSVSPPDEMANELSPNRLMDLVPHDWHHKAGFWLLQWAFNELRIYDDPEDPDSVERNWRLGAWLMYCAFDTLEGEHLQALPWGPYVVRGQWPPHFL